MKHIYLNLKRFDVPASMGGVNRLACVENWASMIVSATQDELKKYDRYEAEFAQFFPEAHILSAARAKNEDSPIQIGCQGVYRDDVAFSGNFGAFTSCRPAAAAVALGCSYAIIGHCEERSEKAGVLAEAGIDDANAVNRLLNKEIRSAAAREMKVLYCVGEKAEEQEHWQQVLEEQLTVGLDGVDLNKVVVAYEPIWSIGPGKKPADKEYITKIARHIKRIAGDVDVVYGGGLKKDNAQMLSSIDEIDGGLIALTRFSGEIGFYPDEYLKIIRCYLGK